MSDETVIPFQRKGRPEQLTLEQVRAMHKAGQTDEIERARKGGHLEDVMKGVKPVKPTEVPK